MPMPEAIQYGPRRAGARRPAFESGCGFDETLRRIDAGIAAADLWVIHVIDPQALVKRADFAMLRARQVLFFHPRFMSKLLAANPEAIVEAPLKFVVVEAPDGRVHVHAPEPREDFARHPGLADLGRELGGLCDPIVDSLAAQRAPSLVACQAM